jgi:hypothetical protein
MKYLEEQARANVKLIESLLHTSFKGANISNDECRLDGRKFKIEAEAKRMLLCVSLEYLSDQRESRIRRDFELHNLAKTLSTSPEEYFLLGNKGMQRIPAQDVAS